jgi:hypothetical protein
LQYRKKLQEGRLTKMPSVKSILIAALLLTNAFTGAALWRLQERIQHSAKADRISRMKAFAPMPSCMKNLDAKDLTYFSASAQQVSIVYRCSDKRNPFSLRFYRWPLSEEPKPSDSFDFGTPQQPDPTLTIALAMADAN